MCICFNKSVLNWTFCLLLTEKPNCNKNIYVCLIIFTNGSSPYEVHSVGKLLASFYRLVLESWQRPESTLTKHITLPPPFLWVDS